jgi:hypothetical protein
MVTGAILILSGAVLVGAGTITSAVAHAANQISSETGGAWIAGSVVGLIGLLILVSGFVSDSKGRPQT